MPRPLADSIDDDRSEDSEALVTAYPDKLVHLDIINMPSEEDTIRGIIEDFQATHSTNLWIKALLDDKNSLDRIDACKVVKVIHLRTKKNLKCFIPHELVRVELECPSTDSGPVLRRKVFMQRGKRVELSKSEGPTSMSWSSVSINAKVAVNEFAARSSKGARTLFGLDVGNIDSAYVTENPKRSELDEPYDVVQTLEVSEDARYLNVLHCAAIAECITTLAEDYSIYSHMCMWWATVSFQAFVRLHAALSKTAGLVPMRGPLYNQRGMFPNKKGVIRIVNDDGSFNWSGPAWSEARKTLLSPFKQVYVKLGEIFGTALDDDRNRETANQKMREESRPERLAEKALARCTKAVADEEARRNAKEAARKAELDVCSLPQKKELRQEKFDRAFAEMERSRQELERAHEWERLQFERARVDFEHARGEFERARKELERAREESEHAREESERAREESERAREESERAREQDRLQFQHALQLSERAREQDRLQSERTRAEVADLQKKMAQFMLTVRTDRVPSS
ncbi:hypothetical protein FISHEDRAFT_75898 [Fistulina hepatica ATCC 64428]|uniref:Uncharacterized protein n=1 Tax=Fistulina hepatica ATCC 64428 TaxID=1128425 RepID=A0A0D7A4V3_9AGAR|nr:hypothetical protein FISHEDRAFT_75898 [Fistulina hepatica ATCC 64428]